MSGLVSSSETVTMPPQSRYAGQPADTSSRRSIRLRSGDCLDRTLPHATVDYFYHAGRFWTATIPLGGVQEVRGQAFNFSKPKTRKTPSGPEPIVDEHGVPKRSMPLLNHVQTRFILAADTPVRLFELGENVPEQPVHEIHDLVYSLEAVGPVGVNFNLRDGMTGSLICAHRFLSTEEMVFERIVVENQSVLETPAIPLNSAQRQSALIMSLDRSHQAGGTETYHLYRCCGTNNCTSNPFQIIDKVAVYRPHHRLGSLLFRLPLHPRFYLRVRGLDPDPTRRFVVRTEFEAFIEDQEVQQRKRDYVRAKIRERRAARAEAT